MPSKSGALRHFKNAICLLGWGEKQIMHLYHKNYLFLELNRK